MAAKQTDHPLPWYKQTHFLIAMVVIALLVGMNAPDDSSASLAPSPSIEVPAPTIQPAPAPPVVQAPAPTPPASPVTVINVIGQQETPQIIRELQPIIYRQSAPEPTPELSVPEPAPEPAKQANFNNERCQRMMAEHQRRVKEMYATLDSYHP